METYDLKNDLKVFGKEVKTFPLGVKEAFGALLDTIPEGFKRSYYGLSHMDDKGKMVYLATAEEKYEGEAEKYNCERYIVEKGEYLAVPVNDWLKKIDCIKDVFHDMMEDDRADKTKPVVEWYKTETEMLCLVKIKEHETIQ
jgi:predicted transcriptional regulator YdeE